MTLAAAVMGALQAGLAWRLDWTAMGKLQCVMWMGAALPASALLYFGMLRLLRVDLRSLMRRRAAS